MCLCVDACGHGDGKGTHLSAYLHLMKGSHDVELTWPLRGKIEIKLLNQISDCEHRLKVVTYEGDTKRNSAYGVTQVDQNERGWGYTYFLCNQILRGTTPTCQYLKDDCLFFQVTKL